MDRCKRPIGVFDSGVGGISVLRELAVQLPNENYIFYGDSKNAPYGTKDVETVRSLTLADASFLLGQGVKALVVACNTATSAAIIPLRTKYKNIPVIGIEPALKPAVTVKDYPRVIVMATPMTLREEKFHRLLSLHEQEAEIISLPCPGLMECVEHGELESEHTKELLRNLFSPYRKKPIDAVVLGCTHYPFLKKAIGAVIGTDVPLFDGGAGTAKETKRRLSEMGLLNPSRVKGTVTFENSLESEEILHICRKLFDS